MNDTAPGGVLAPAAADAPPGRILRRSEWSGDVGGDVAARLARDLGPDAPALVLIFAGGARRQADAAAAARAAFPGSAVIGCTTAGEIGRAGYADGGVVAVGLPASHFAVRTRTIAPLGEIATADLARELSADRVALAAECPGFGHEFALSLVDGLSMAEDRLAAVLGRALGPLPQFGASAGDDRAYRATAVAADGASGGDRAVVALVRSACPVRVFSVDHLRPTERRLVVTDADPARRIVRRLNGAPAAAEYARVLGCAPVDLDAHVFAAHPVVVRLGGGHHARSIQHVEPTGELVFHSAIDSGVILSLAEPGDMAAHLDRELAALSAPVAPDGIIGFDCILRRTEAASRQAAHRVSGLLARHRVAGFCTYGEQFAGRHVNQTLTGVAIYPPSGHP